MTFIDLLREAWFSLQAYRLRALLTMLGIIIGIAAVAIIVGIGAGSQKVVEEALQSLGSNMLIIEAGSRVNAKGRPVGTGKLSWDDYEMLRTLPNAKSISAITQPIMKTAQNEGNVWNPSVMGATSDFFTIRKWEFSEGHPFDEEDENASRLVAVLGKKVADNLFPGQPALGQTIKIDQAQFEVVGVTRAKGQDMNGQDQDNLVVVPYTTAQRRIFGPRTLPSIPMIMMEASSSRALPHLMHDIDLLMRDRHHIQEDDASDVNVNNMAALVEGAKSSSQALSLMLSSVAGISLIVGGIGIMNMMLVAVTERTREIGVRKALGAGQLDIMIQFLLEALIITLCGSLFGLAAGGVGLWIAYAVFAIPVVPTVWAFVLSILVALLVGLVFGYYPARRAARLSAMEALRYQ